MDTQAANPNPANRPVRAGLSALLVVGLLIGVTVSAVRPGVRALHRDASAELLATRQIAQTIVRAVRGLASTDVHRPAIRRPVAAATHRDTPWPALASHRGDPRPPLLRESLLALPPPVA